VILETPKLKEHRDRIRATLAEALGLAVDRVSVKFKTAEKLGAVGEGRAAEAQAVATLEG
jgi:2-C-methyl-D-erythritol 2,4-cyclodiphosphate synthase